MKYSLKGREVNAPAPPTSFSATGFSTSRYVARSLAGRSVGGVATCDMEAGEHMKEERGTELYELDWQVSGGE